MKYMPLLQENNILNGEVAKHKWPSQFWEVKSTEDLIALMRSYNLKSPYWARYILTLIKLYCIPDNNVRKASLENLILMINKQLNSKLQVPLAKDAMQLMLSDGHLVEDITQISFQTTKLFLTKKEAAEQTYQDFLSMEKQYAS